MALNETYTDILSEVKLVCGGEPDLIANLSNVASIVYWGLNAKKNNRVNWVGFYLTKENNTLVLGPFQGKVACVRIKFGRGVCGAAASTKTTQARWLLRLLKQTHLLHLYPALFVPDVHNFPGHIACDSGSNSEVVVPIISKDGSVLGVFDLDHLDVDGFSEEDKVGLEAIGSFVETLFSAPSALNESKAH